MRTFFALMSKTRNEQPAHEDLINKKDGFVLYKDRCKLAVNFLNIQERGELFTAIVDYVHNDLPQLSNDKINICYSFIIDGINRENAKYKAESERRAEYYRRKNKQSTTNTDNTDFTENTDKNIISVQNRNGEGNGNGEGNKTNRKEFNINNKIFLDNKEYTRRYLAEKKIFLKPSAFDSFFDYNVSIGFPYKPETAAKRWIKKNPDDEQKPTTEKKPPQPPTTPAEFKLFREQLLDVLRNNVPAIDFKTWIQPIEVLKTRQNANNTADIALGMKSKFFAEYVKQNYECEIADAFKILKGVEPCIYYTFVDGNEIKTFQPGTLKCLTKN